MHCICNLKHSNITDLKHDDDDVMLPGTIGDIMPLTFLPLYRAKENLASAKIVKIEFNANLELLGFPHFITFKECRKVS